MVGLTASEIPRAELGKMRRTIGLMIAALMLVIVEWPAVVIGQMTKNDCYIPGVETTEMTVYCDMSSFDVFPNFTEYLGARPLIRLGGTAGRSVNVTPDAVRHLRLFGHSRAMPQNALAMFADLRQLVVDYRGSSEVGYALADVPVNVHPEAFAGLERLERLTLLGLKFTPPVFPESMERLPALRELNLERCDLDTSFGRDQLKGSRNLSSFSVSIAERLTFDDDAFADHVDTLKRLELHRVSMKRVPTGLARMRSLEEATLSGEFSSLPPGLFAASGDSLTRLSVQSDNLTTIDRRTFDGLKSLRRLTMWRCRLSDLPRDVFADLTSLEELDLSLNRLTNVDGLFAKNANLSKLLLNNNQLTEFGPGSGLRSNLRQLALRSNPLRRLDTSLLTDGPKTELFENNIDSLAGFLAPGSRFDSLDLSFNPIGEIRPSDFLNVSIGHLTLSGINGTTFDLSALNQVADLTTLTLGWNSYLTTVRVSSAEKVPKTLKRLELPGNFFLTLTEPDSEMMAFLRNNNATVRVSDLMQCDCHLSWLTSDLWPKDRWSQWFSFESAGRYGPQKTYCYERSISFDRYLTEIPKICSSRNDTIAD